MATQSDRVFFFCCVSCMKNKNIEEYAVYYCEKCQQCFCRQCCELHHDYLFSEHVKYDRLNMRNWPVSKELEAVILMCEIHTHKQLETICKDHSQLCCSKCVSLSHRKCKKVTLNSAKKQAAEVQELFEKLLINMRKLRKLQSCCESGIHDLKSSYQGQELMVHKMNDKIKSTMAKIVRRTLKKIPKVEQNKIYELMHSTLFHIENITLNEAKITLSSLEDSLKTGVETCIRHHHELKALHELLLYSSDNKKKKLCMIASQKCMDKIQKVESYLDEYSVRLECSVLNQTIQGTKQYIVRLSGLGRLIESMKANTDIEQYLSKLSGLARLVLRNHVLTVHGKSKHTVRITSDSKQCFITAICVLPDGQVLVADRDNERVKLLNQQYQVVSHWDVNDGIWDMCQITPSEVAVAVNNEVQFITVSQSQLAKGRKLKLQHYCTGIALHQGDLYICSRTALYKFTLSGKLVCRLYEDTSSDWTVYKCAVSPTGDRLYITSPSQHKLLTLARDGTLLATYTDPALDVPSGLHVTPAGQVLVCGWHSATVLQVGWEGESKLANLATWGVWYPQSVCYSSTTSSIIVGQYNDNIVVFRVE
ncbi:uncharacterized protein LOC127874187 [Dreissena polymorpha]|uniref:uncharacterized protein LOC127874187 n=1 Tax=Dreissena polymorpha TaxID=45954 RepID=UPI002264ACA9|nr:uncharacterized protein LOC127874187 [Dreissena polymorpha]XP_052274355.1 uncharacterized protein LOC127874187 [Dreissena polymorpha]